jgi:hypothetical protein
VKKDSAEITHELHDAVLEFAYREFFGGVGLGGGTYCCYISGMERR